MSACGKSNRWRSALCMLLGSPKLRFWPDAIMYSTAILACAISRESALALAVFSEASRNGIELAMSAASLVLSESEQHGWSSGEDKLLAVLGSYLRVNSVF